MKTLLASLLFAAGLSAQTTTVTPAFVVKTSHLGSVQRWILTQTASTPTTSPGAILVGDTSVTVADASACLPAILNPDAPIGTLCSILIESEAALVTAVSGNVLTVTRGTLGTAAAAHAAGISVQFLKYKNVPDLIKIAVARLIGGMVDQYPPATITTQTAAIAAAQAAIVAEKATSVQ